MTTGVQLPGSWPIWLIAGGVFVLLLLAVSFGVSYVLRRSLRRRSDAAPADEFSPPQPRVEDEAAFAAASMQAVIRRLREQEKEVERLRKIERERADETRRLTEAVTRNMPTGLLLINAAGLVTTTNPAAETTLGVGALAYHRYTELLGADSHLARLLGECLRAGRTFQREEVVHKTREGRVHQLGVTISPIYEMSTAPHPAIETERARITGALCLLSDLTELSELQKQVRLKESLATLGEMSAGIAHEFKNALATISGYAQMLRNDGRDAELTEHATRILEESRALTHVVTEFLKFARPIEPGSEAVSLAPVVERVMEEIREGMPSVQVTSEGEFGEVQGDEGLLRQALLNLVRNAAQAAAGAAGRGQVVVRGCRIAQTGGMAQQVRVADNGPGIPAPEMEKLFLPFYTTKTDGTGLGLAIVQKIAVQHGGGVEARNLAGGGAEFILWLPVRAGQPRAVDSPSRRI